MVDYNGRLQVVTNQGRAIYHLGLPDADGFRDVMRGPQVLFRAQLVGHGRITAGYRSAEIVGRGELKVGYCMILKPAEYGEGEVYNTSEVVSFDNA